MDHVQGLIMDFKLYSVSVEGFIFNKYSVESDGKIIYEVKSKGIGPFRSYVFYDSSGLAYLEFKRKYKLFQDRFEISKNGIPFAEVIVKGRFKKTSFDIISDRHHYTAISNLRMNDFTVLDGDSEIAKISRKSLKRKDRYGIAMNAEANEDLILSFTLILERLRKIRKARRSV